MARHGPTCLRQLQPEYRQRLLVRYAEGNEWIRQRFLPQRQQLFDPPPDEAPPTLHVCDPIPLLVRQGGSEMNLRALLARIRPRRSRLLAAVSEEQAVALLREALDEILCEMERIEDACIPIYRFGTFHVRLTRDGRKHITFEPWEGADT